MEITLLIVSALLVLLGFAGSFLPVLPGPPLSWAGLLLLKFTNTVTISTSLLIITGIVAVLIWVLDYIIPAIGAKKFGGTKYGMLGTTIGLVIGLVAPIPGGIIIGPFVGAFVGELINNNDTKIAFKAALGSFIGFLASTFIKFMVCLVFLGLYIKILWDNKDALTALFSA
ncbi:MAG: DUF456 domain-containing protein [Flavobacteriaceae bacterium]